MERDPSEGGSPVADRLEAVRLEFDAQVRRIEQAKAGLQEIIDQIYAGRSQRQILHDSAFARLAARMTSMPTIEQAKGILMAEQRCGPDEAFDLLRRASQRANIKVSVLAAQIVEQIASQATGLSAVPAKPTAITSHARGCPPNLQSGTSRANDQPSASHL